jgi:hypothetical protein
MGSNENINQPFVCINFIYYSYSFLDTFRPRLPPLFNGQYFKSFTFDSPTGSTAELAMPQ